MVMRSLQLTSPSSTTQQALPQLAPIFPLAPSRTSLMSTSNRGVLLKCMIPTHEQSHSQSHSQSQSRSRKPESQSPTMMMTATDCPLPLSTPPEYPLQTCPSLALLLKVHPGGAKPSAPCISFYCLALGLPSDQKKRKDNAKLSVSFIVVARCLRSLPLYYFKVCSR